VALVASVTTLAAGAPARRASNVNPIEALRQQ
jgi:ABC-type lipoprotein release transport system permease subunit